MFESIRGIVVRILPFKVTVEVNGIGYAIFISLKTFQKLSPINQEIFFHVTTVIREESHSLFGFFSLEEKELFERLIAISGIGPKMAIAILGHLETADFTTAILQSNIALLSKIPGIGKKTAARLIIELKEKLVGTLPNPLTQGIDLQTIGDAEAALIHLGYSSAVANKAVYKAASSQPHLSLTELISRSLRSI